MFDNNATKLIKSFESLTYRDKILEIIKLGRQEKTDSTVVDLINDLQQGNHYERLLGLYSCYGSYNGERVLTAIKDNSRSIRNKAIALLTLVGNDTQVLAALDNINSKQRQVLLKHLRKRKRLELIDTCLIRLSDREEEKVERLLVYGTAELVNSHLDKILERAGINEWSVLAKLHPEIALNALHKYTKSSLGITGRDWRFVSYFNTIIPRLAELYPDRVLSLTLNLVDHPSFFDLAFEKLYYYRPLEVANIFLNSFPNVRANLNVIAHKLPLDLLIDLINKQYQTVNNYADWLPKLKPEQRTAIYDRCHLSWRSQNGCLSIDLIELFPRKIREKEARYHLDLPALATRPNELLVYATFLPWDEAWEIIQSYLKNPDADLRILALTTIINTTKYHRSRLPELLEIIKQRKNEQDPVRNAMLYSLAGLPPSIWQEKHLADLDTIFNDALQAADLSAATANHAQHLVIEILPFHPQRSAEWLSKFVQARGRINFYNLESRLNESQVKTLAPILLPVFRSWETRESEWNIIEAGNSFGKRLEVFDGLVDILERVLDSTKDKWNAARILNILAEYRRDRLKFLIPQLIKQDSSWFTQPVVSNYLHNFRQDLLTPFLGQTTYRGRFSTGKTRYVIFFYGGYSRWTLQQQKIFARSLDNLTRDDKRDSPAVWSAIDELASLPAIATPKRLIQLASIKNPQEAIRDRALRALARLDSGQGTPILLSALEDSRARIAIYALRKSLMEMSVTEAVSILKNVNSQKVTVNKEIVRLLGDLDSATAFKELKVKISQDSHRDVRIASLRALWEHLEKAETWNILEQAAIDPDEAVATMVGRTPGDRLSDEAQARLISLLITLLNRPEPTLRLTILRRCHSLPVRDTEQILLPQLLKSLNSNYFDEVKAAADAIFATYQNAELIAQTIQQILPNRRGLNLVLSSLQYRLAGYTKEKVAMLKTILAILEPDPVTTSWQIKLATASLPGNELTEFLINLNNRGELHADALVVAKNTLSCACSHPDLEQIEMTLAASKDEKLRRLAISALMAQKTRLGWNQLRVDRLLAYRQDSSALVAAAAQFIFPPDNIIE